MVPGFAWLILSGLFNALGEYLSKEWGNTPSLKLALFVALAYVASSIVWLPALLHHHKLSVYGTAWILIALIFTLFLGLFVFKEHLSTAQWQGVFLAVIAVVLLLS